MTLSRWVAGANNHWQHELNRGSPRSNTARTQAFSRLAASLRDACGAYRRRGRDGVLDSLQSGGRVDGISAASIHVCAVDRFAGTRGRRPADPLLLGKTRDVVDHPCGIRVRPADVVQCGGASNLLASSPRLDVRLIHIATARGGFREPMERGAALWLTAMISSARSRAGVVHFFCACRFA